jgi:hypothetical protein
MVCLFALFVCFVCLFFLNGRRQKRPQNCPNVVMETRLFVGHLPLHAREIDVQKLFSTFGRVASVSMKRQYAFVVHSTIHAVSCRSYRSKRIVQVVGW